MTPHIQGNDGEEGVLGGELCSAHIPLEVAVAKLGTRMSLMLGGIGANLALLLTIFGVLISNSATQSNMQTEINNLKIQVVNLQGDLKKISTDVNVTQSYNWRLDQLEDIHKHERERGR